MGRLQNTFRALVTQMGFEVVSIVVAFVAVPLYLVYLGAERYGLYLTAQAWAGYLGFGNASISQSTMILVSHAAGRDDPAELSRIVRTSLVLSILAALVVSLISLGGFYALHVDGVAKSLKLTHAEAPGLVLAIGLQVMCGQLFGPFYDVLIGLQQLNRASLLQGANRVVSQLGSLAVAIAGGSVGLVTTASALTTVLVGVACAAHTRRAHPQAFGSASVTAGQVMLQLRTGAKSFGLQVGATFAGTAPTFALATLAGPAFVPLYAVPARLFSIGTGMVNSFAAMLQPSFGEAYARTELTWIRSTLAQVFEKTLLMLGILAAGLVGIGEAFISVWTKGKLEVPVAMLASVAMAGGVSTLLAPVRFLLTGINRHRWAAATELANGVLATGFSFLAVRLLSPNWVGCGVFLASASTSLWILPAQARLHLGMQRLLPGPSKLVRLALCALAVYGSARLMANVSAEFVPGQKWAALLASAAGAIAAGACGMVGLKLIEWRELYRRLRTQGS